MSKKSNLDSILLELRRNAKSIMELADALEKEFSKENTPKTTSAVKEESSTTEENVPTKEIKLADIKVILMEKSRAGFDTEVHELIQSYGVPKLSAIDKCHYAELLQKAEVIGNA